MAALASWSQVRVARRGLDWAELKLTEGGCQSWVPYVTLLSTSESRNGPGAGKNNSGISGLGQRSVLSLPKTVPLEQKVLT